ncbi:hypothetical protein KM176_15180 [Pseudooceanicola sp. CBS1P-1]|uniref:FCD domain-containing protein n=1 Tax=Pseudooceanicola albus TaxID=2692189 RepID=A0A6L7G2Y7_9RHOB|nr:MULTISPECIES: hypothetical protein [Pseudooceanicola]MBT9385213.1 hypothetical protein [Pseudooceanicola endophyticus]MXN18495.1 hypothetical protein [Pseudooceanicola albus]
MVRFLFFFGWEQGYVGPVPCAFGERSKTIEIRSFCSNPDGFWRDSEAHYTFATHPIRTRAFPNDAIREIAIEEHFRMIEILGRGDPEALREVILSHIRRPKDFYLKANFIMERAL